MAYQHYDAMQVLHQTDAEYSMHRIMFRVIQIFFSPFDNECNLSGLNYGKHVDDKVCNPNVYATWFGLRKLCAVVSEIRCAQEY
jgi:hypothetical protein